MKFLTTYLLILHVNESNGLKKVAGGGKSSSFIIDS